ncbi:MAG: sugar ABC transporter substrate-binding protein [Actinobacteria bacterium]|nr:sugar ABC transporter substrate-binding protein [Cyanobacteriota bacterium]MCL5771797.1 sugar ABC transporter substrate-binding protein [Actinomycetota bacterium]
MMKKILIIAMSLSVVLMLAVGVSCAPTGGQQVGAVQESTTTAAAETTAAATETTTAAAETTAAEGEKKPVKIGVIQITLEHEYQVMLNRGFLDQAKKMGPAEVVVQVNDMNPEKCVKVAEDLIAAGVNAIICAPADPASWKSVLELCKKAGIPLLNDGSPQPIEPGMVPFIGTDSLGGGEEAGKFAANWINENLGGNAKVVGLTLPTFTDCVARNEGFNKALKENVKGKITLIEQNGSGLREKGLEAMENILQGNPDVDVLFGCNDDSALGGMSAMQAAGLDKKDHLVIGFDGTLGAFNEIKNDTMMRLDIVQQPYLYASMHMERAINLARGEKTIDYYQSQGPIYIKTPVVTKENVDEWIKKVSEIMPK